MQKKIVALAIAAAFSAPAFADTAVYGIVDAAITNISTTNMKSDLNVTSGGLSTSRLGVKASEDLDNGMKAIAVLEYKLDVANATTLVSTRQQMLALAGDFGTVAAGYLQTTGYDFSNKFNPFAGSAVDPYTTANPTSFISTGSRAARAAAYISPSMGGVTVAINHAFDATNVGAVANGVTTVAGNKTTANLVSVNFDQGPLSVGGVYAGTANDGTNYEKVTEMGLGASYDLGVAKLFGAYLTTKKNANAASLAADAAAGNSNKLLSFSAVAPVGPGAVVFGYAKNTKAATTAADNTTAYTAAYLQNLSKTTTAYVALEKATTQAAPSDISTTAFAVGLRKKF